MNVIFFNSKGSDWNLDVMISKSQEPIDEEITEKLLRQSPLVVDDCNDDAG